MPAPPIKGWLMTVELREARRYPAGSVITRLRFRPVVCTAMLRALGCVGEALAIEQLRPVGEAHAFIPLAFRNHPIVEADVRRTSPQLAHFEGRYGLLRNVKAFAVAVGGEINVIVNAGVNRLREHRFQVDGCRTIRELAGAEILKPVLRRFDGIERDHAGTVVHRNHGRLGSCACQVAARGDGARSTDSFTKGLDHRIARIRILVIYKSSGVELVERVSRNRDQASSDGKRLATASDDRTARVWDAGSGKELLVLRGHAGPVVGVAFSPDGKVLATASADKTAKLWDAANGKELLTLHGHAGPVNAVAFSPDGKHVASASDDQTAKLWDVESGKELLTFRGHTGLVRCVIFSPDGRRVATASWDRTAKVWDASNGKELLTVHGHAGDVYSVAFSPDGKRVATAGFDGTGQIYALEIQALLDLARTRVTRDFTPDECKRYFQSQACPPLR